MDVVDIVYPLKLTIDPDAILLPDDIFIVSLPENDSVKLIRF